MVEINNLTATKVKEEFLKRIAEDVLKNEKKENSYISVALVEESRIKELNKKYRKKNKPTDVLSFNQIESGSLSKLKGLGEIIICPRQVKKNALKLKIDFEKELVFCLIHGILHLLGYDHEVSQSESEKMAKKEDSHLKKYFNPIQ